MAGKSIKLEIGTVYKKSSDGNYFFRYQVNHERKAVCLKTKNQDEAVIEAKKLIPVVKGTTLDVISAHVKNARGLTYKKKSLPLNLVWNKYSEHPERATPATVHEQESYKSTFDEFVKFIGNEFMEMLYVTPEIADKFALYLRKTKISVSTHNRKIKRLRKIFQVLSNYRGDINPFTAKSLMRKAREEQENEVRRLSFTREQEQKLLEVLEDDKHKLMNKPEIRIIYHLGMFIGQRLKDCVLLRWDKVDLNSKKIWVKQFKTGKDVTIPIAAKLMDALLEAKTWKQNEYVCPNVATRYRKEDKNGKNTGNNLVDIDVIRVIKWIGLEPSVEVPGRKKKVTVYGFHSLRHSFASHCAEAGVPKAVVMSILGTNSEIVDKYYTHIGEEAQEKAIQAITGSFTSVSDRERIKKVLSLIDSCKVKPKIVKEIEEILR